ncbi:MAG: T9SS type A sorting domain-containing protein, partial [Flavobacteriales bacterium]
INACGQSGTRGLAVSLLTCMGGSDTGDAMLKSLVNAYPNPNDGNFVVQAYAEGQLLLLNAYGQVVRTMVFTENNAFHHEILDLSTGVYFLRGYLNGESINEKVMVTNQ